MRGVKKMKIKELEDQMKDIVLTADIMEISPVRVFNKQKVCSAKISDDTGECYLDLWNENATRFKAGDTIKLMKGFCKVNKHAEGTFVNVTPGRYGTLLKIKK